jgi:hypothetical protein
MADQEQEIGNGSVAIQADGNVTVNTGLSPSQMRETMNYLSELHKDFTEIAMITVNERIKDFQDRMIERFEDGEKANSESFKDPDFQIVLAQAQKAFARNGDSQVADTIVDIIAERSKKTERDRLQITLNEAVEIASTLTVDEFAILSLCFIVRYTQKHGLINVNYFVEYIKTEIVPLLMSIPKNEFSYQFLEAQRCANLEMGSVNLVDIYSNRYGGLFSKGFTIDQLKDCLPEGKKDIFDTAVRDDNLKPLLLPCLHDRELLQLNAISCDEFMNYSKRIDLGEDERTSVSNLFKGTFMNLYEMKEILKTDCPDFETLADLWNGTSIKHLKLTSIGIAIAHSNLRKLTGFSADLSIWID